MVRDVVIGSVPSIFTSQQLYAVRAWMRMVRVERRKESNVQQEHARLGAWISPRS
ncbi:TRIC cation channel family protein [Corynebacterium cystitidis]|uniref:TRIC cation channel family protein n=1 Tax=Corynebacterium cystitidis TaxID=35757 RepID=UPI00211F0F4D|nr:TRIC cation channel family protein [Corynebacterium cystitidis]